MYFCQVLVEIRFLVVKPPYDSAYSVASVTYNFIIADAIIQIIAFTLATISSSVPLNLFAVVSLYISCTTAVLSIKAHMCLIIHVTNGRRLARITHFNGGVLFQSIYNFQILHCHLSLSP